MPCPIEGACAMGFTPAQGQEAQCTRRPYTRIQLSPKQAHIYAWGRQKAARFRYALCGRRFGKTYLCRK